MIKALWFAFKIGVFVALAVWVADRPGSMRLEWVDLQGNDIAVTVHIGLFLLFALGFVLLTLFVYQTIKTFVNFPKSFARYNEIKAREKGYMALTKGLTAVAAGDTKAAVAYSRRAGKLLEGDTGLPLLLEAQAARLDGREEDAAKSFVALLEDKDASFLGVRGLLQTALDSGDDEGALLLAEKALKLHPRQGWILKIVYDLQTRLGQWFKAERTLTKTEKAGAINAEKAKSDRVALYLAQAEKDLKEGFRADAVLVIKKAIKLDPAFPPSSMMLADIFLKDGHKRKAQNLILKAWKVEPHGALAVYWMAIGAEDRGDDKLAALRRIERLLKANVDSAIGQRMAGQASVGAGLWGEAREYFRHSEELGPTAALYTAWAELEELSAYDEQAAKDWLSKASSAPVDCAWVCEDTGMVYGCWLPVCSGAQGRFNSLRWVRPSGRNAPLIVLDHKVQMSEAVIEAPQAADSDAA